MPKRGIDKLRAGWQALPDRVPDAR
jgi:hypothetical protein